ncbi:Tripartite-type tricarboxylate transporter, receptor component TctC [Roseomonas rosea]|uniref:Tripartite-type tricarboxylate transporter, receptor component TctC n=1 Tax=Muricoccus roseus TaxID=198092 RepID=A0A1M6D2T7_9PROT|nr:tripartite tricarboxylate transporter substrate binding protein [Roseomonas rosea]SHI67394.1 Tripartite-type tricarboxylate transporter, receptor component TctC [Roseomonas rosea]
MVIRRRGALGLMAAGMATGLARRAAAQPAWPSRPVSFIVPFAAGGASDVVARASGNQMSQAIGQPVVVENKPTANGQIAARQLARSAPDGYTVLVGSIGVFALNAVLYRDPGYDPLRDFAPVTLAVTTPNVLVTNPEKVPATDLPGVIAWMKANAGQVFHATSGIGSSPHLTMELFTQKTGTEATHVPSRGGAAAVTDQLAGRTQISFQGLGTIIEPVKDGRLRAILVTSAERNPLLPDVPTARECGLSDFEVSSWQAVMEPAGLPAPVLRRLHEEVVRALRHPEVAPRLEAAGYGVVGNTPEEYGAFQRAEIERWRRVASAARISLD